MEVILLERVEKLGQMGEIVRVKSGYARNFLLPKKKALRATQDNIGYFESQKTELEVSNLRKKEEAEGIAKKLKGTSVVMVRQAGESGQLYGSVNARDIADGLRAEGMKVDRTQVELGAVIKELGHVIVQVRLHPEVVLPIKVNVARSKEEASIQAAAASDLMERAEDAEKAVEQETEAEKALAGEEKTDDASPAVTIDNTDEDEQTMVEAADHDASK